jgi:hypothetical protein
MGSSSSSLTPTPQIGRFWGHDVEGHCPFCEPGPGYDTVVRVASTWDEPNDDNAKVTILHAPKPHYTFLSHIICPGIPPTWSVRQVIAKCGEKARGSFSAWVRK